MLFRYDEYCRRLDSGYPRHIRNWRGVPSDIDGVITWTDGAIHQYTESRLPMQDAISGLTYFFKDGKYWRFNDYMVITESEVPQDSASIWFGC